MKIDLPAAKSAALNWQKRTKEREKASRNLEAGKTIAADTPERVQKRLVHLSEVALKSPAPISSADAETLVKSFALERIIGSDDLMDINMLELALAVSRFVGRINIRSSSKRTIGYGTGFMVSPRLLLTNNHVFPAPGDAAPSLVEFDYQLDRFGRLLPVRSFCLEPETFFITSPQLDFTLVAVHPMAEDNTELKHFAWLHLIGAEGKILIGDPVNIIQHPGGAPKHIAFRNNRLLDLFDIYEHYETDSEPGSSGSPVFNDQWEVVALHHSGVPKMKDGQLIAKDGSVWKDGMDPSQLEWVANEGIRISRLISSIQQQALTGEQARLRDELLNLEQPNPLEVAANFQEITTGKQPAAGPKGGDAGEFTINIPLQISVRFGTPIVSGNVSVQSPSTGAKPVPVDNKIPAATPPPAEPQELPKEVHEALAELKQADAKPYYDEQADQADCGAYYKDIDSSQGPDGLYHALNSLLTNTHKTVLPYKPIKHLYPWVDLHKTDHGMEILSIYSGKGFDPEAFILADYHIEQERERLMAMRAREMAFSPLSEAALFDALEVSLPYNCEHVVPQSWFEHRLPMVGDLHHLFAVESGCNSFRGNTPYNDFPEEIEKTRGDCGRLEKDGFEPNAGKGPVARAILYFLLRYPGEINNTVAEYSKERIRLFVDWHMAYPPDLYERHRNRSIFEKQGNRNPLIDHPEWAGAIDFTLGIG
jgi:endonuclease G, mitochondrial